MRTYSCPVCDEEITIRLDITDYVRCPNCKSILSVDTDGEFVDGMWRDLTTLYLIKTYPETK